MDEKTLLALMTAIIYLNGQFFGDHELTALTARRLLRAVEKELESGPLAE